MPGQGYHKYAVVSLTGGKNKHQNMWTMSFSLVLPDVPYCSNLRGYRGFPHDAYSSIEKHICQWIYYRKPALKPHITGTVTQQSVSSAS